MKKFKLKDKINNIKEDENTDKVSDIANQFKAMASEPKVGIKKLPDVNAPGVPDMFKVKKLEEEGEGGAARRQPVPLLLGQQGVSRRLAG